MKLGIIGLGTVGKAIRDGLGGAHEIFVHDIELGTSISDITENTDFAYIAVPTPTDEETLECDTSIVESVLSELPGGFSAVIKSTVIPGTTQRLHNEFKELKIACSPEFLRTETAEEDFRNQDILVVGSHHEDIARSVHRHHLESGILQKGHFFHVTPTQAEIVKYAKNSFYSLKVIFGNQFQQLSNHLGEDWGEIKSIITHPQEQGIVDSHLDEIPGEFGFGGHCLPKDAMAILTELKKIGLDYELLSAVIDDNARLRGESQ